MNIFFIFKNHATGCYIAVGSFNHFNQTEINFRVNIEPVALKINHDVIFRAVWVNLLQSSGNTIRSARKFRVSQNSGSPELLRFIHQNLVSCGNDNIPWDNGLNIFIHALQNTFAVHVK